MSPGVLALAGCLITAGLAAPCSAADNPAPQSPATSPAGAALYLSHCAMCHDHAVDRIPPKVYIATTRSTEDIIDTLTLGAMRPQAAGLSAERDPRVAVYLTGRDPPAQPPRMRICARPLQSLRFTPHDWRSWGRDLDNSRFQPHGGLTAADVPKLKLRWTFAFRGAPRSASRRWFGGLVLAGGTGGRVFALDADTGCTYWSYAAGALVRTGIVIGRTTAAHRRRSPGAHGCLVRR